MSTKDEQEKPTEAEIVGRSRIGHLYTHEWPSGEGKFLNFIIDDSGQAQGVDMHLEPQARNRIKVTISFVRGRGEITKIEIKKFKHYKNRGWQPCPDDESGFGHQHVSLRPFSFERLLAFLQFIAGLDIPGITERRLALTIDESQALDEESKRKLRTVLMREGGSEVISELLRSDLIPQDIVNLGYRKRQLTLFGDLLANPQIFEVYRQTNSIRADQSEAVWQHFFMHNEWIFGYGLDYRFQGVLQAQFHASDADADGSQAVITDFLLGDKRFTTFVELKKPETPLFAETQNRSRTWRLSSHLLDSVSQILEQKASGQLRFEGEGLYDRYGARITQRPHDPKVILIIGHWRELDKSASEREREAKKRTLELFRRDSRNVEIVTFDELFDRAKFIVEHRERGTSSQA